MLEKSSFPLNNPLSEKSLNNNNNVDDVVKGKSYGVSKGEKKNPLPVEVIVRCPHCGHKVKVVYTYGSPPKWIRCTGCNELQPADGYRVLMYGSGLPEVLSREEISSRKLP